MLAFWCHRGELESAGAGVYVRRGKGDWTEESKGVIRTIISTTEDMLGVRDLMYVTSFNLHDKSMKDMSLFPLLKMRKLRLKEVNYQAQGHTASKWIRIRIQTQVCQKTKSTCLATKHRCLSSAQDQGWISWEERLNLVTRGLKRESGFIYGLEWEQQSKLGANLAPRDQCWRHFYCHNNDLASNVHGARVEESWVRGILWVHSSLSGKWRKEQRIVGHWQDQRTLEFQ